MILYLTLLLIITNVSEKLDYLEKILGVAILNIEMWKTG